MGTGLSFVKNCLQPFSVAPADPLTLYFSIPEGDPMDCLLLHVPKYKHHYGPYGEAMFINYLACGMFSLASEVQRKGYSVEVVHLGLEQMVNARFDLAHYLTIHRPAVVGLSLYWHHQSPDTLAVARTVRETLPDSFIVLGGHTASWFAREIIEDYDFIDAVVQGEGERPLVELMGGHASARELSQIPNLVWRDGGEVRINKERWHATDAQLDGYGFSDFLLLASARDYPHLYPYMFPPRRRFLNRLLFEKRRTAAFLIPLGRGCNLQCAWCGGGKEATRTVLARKCPGRLSADAVMEHLERALRFGYSAVATDFDGPGVEEVIAEVLAMCRRRGLRPSWALDAWTLPSKDFIDDFSATVGPGSSLEFSPDLASEELREKYKAYRFTNDDLFRTLEYLEKKETAIGLHFIYGLPGQEKTRAETREMVDRLYRFDCVMRIQQHACELDPASPLFSDPDKYGIVPHLTTFADYVEAHSGDFKMGYSLPGRGEDELFAARCNDVCLIGRNGKVKCQAMQAVTSRPALDILTYAAGKTLWGLRYDSRISKLFMPGAK